MPNRAPSQGDPAAGRIADLPFPDAQTQIPAGIKLPAGEIFLEKGSAQIQTHLSHGSVDGLDHRIGENVQAKSLLFEVAHDVPFHPEFPRIIKLACHGMHSLIKGGSGSKYFEDGTRGI